MRGAGRTRRRRERTVNARPKESRSLAPASHPPAADGSVRSVVAPFTAARTLVLKCRTPHLARGAGGAFGFRSLERIRLHAYGAAPAAPPAPRVRTSGKGPPVTNGLLFDSSRCSPHSAPTGVARHALADPSGLH